MGADRRQFLAASVVAGAIATAADEAPAKDDEKFTWFCARVPYNVPNGRHVQRLDEQSVLKFFQAHWRKKDSKAVLGIESYGTHGIFGESGIAPANDQELAVAIEKNTYCIGIETQHGQLEYQSDDDELHMSYYFFDSEFARKNPDRVSFLLHRGWLPTDVQQIKDSKPATHILSRMPTQTCDSNLWDYFKIDGVRLDRIGDVAATMKANLRSDSAEMEKFLTTQPKEQSWAFTLAKYVAENGSFKGNQSELQTTPHLCELNFHAANWGKDGKHKVFEQFIVFDDLWAASHPDMFYSMLRFKNEKLLFVDQPA